MSFRRTALAVVLLVTALSAGCARLPRVELANARRTVSLAQAMGGDTVSPEYYTLARERLLEAEELVEDGDYEQARQVLQLAEFYAGQVIILVYERDDTRLEESSEPAEGGALTPEVSATRRPRELPRVHVVRPGESLWTIAAQSSVYGDALQWPLIYKANRDQIKDPRQIYPKQELTIPRDVSVEEVEAARDMARRSEVFPIPAPVRRPVTR